MANNNPPPIPFALRMMRVYFQTYGRAFPGAASKKAYRMWLTPQKFPAPDREKASIKQAESKLIKIKDTNIQFWSWGEGPSVLFIHGWGGRGTQVASFIPDLIKAGFSVKSFDLPAHGQSDGKMTNAITISECIEEIIQQIDDVHSIITHSFGGMVFSYCYKPTMNLNKVVLLAPPSTLHTPVNYFTKLLNLPKKVQSGLIRQLKDDFGQDIYTKLAVNKNITKVQEPMLIIHDKQDYVVPFRDGQSVAAHAENCEFFPTDTLGHRRVLYDQSTIKKAINFITGP